MTAMYPLLFLVATSSLVLWQYYSGKKPAKVFAPLFYVAMAGFAISFINQPMTMEVKGSKLIFQLLFMGVVSLLTKSLKEKPLVLLFSLAMTVLFTILFVQWDAKRDNPLIPLSEHGELLVELKEGYDAGIVSEKIGIALSRSFHPLSGEVTNLDNYYTVDAPPDASKIIALREKLEDTKGVKYVEYNEIVNIPEEEMNSITRSSKDLGVNDPEVGLQWGLEKMNLEAFHASLKKVKPVRKALIAILDTGVDARHEDLKGSYKSLQKKYDKDNNRHGTHCAGVAAAVTNNKKGIASLAPNNKFIEVTSVKVLAGFGGGTQRGIIAGMIEAADAGADVISMSLGGKTNDNAVKTYTDAVKYCNKKGAIVIVAAGNSNINAKLFAPANTPGVITVAAVDENLKKASFSNTTDDIEMAVSAPGVKIHSTLPGNKYGALSGTSMSTPYVAGLVGIMKSIKPDLTTKEAFDILNDSGQATKDVQQIGRLIQPKKAIDSVKKNG